MRNKERFGNNTFGGALMENGFENMQTTAYDFENSHYEVVRIFDKSKDVKSIIKDIISNKNKEALS